MTQSVQSAPLQLNNYFFPVVNVLANPEWTSEHEKNGKLPQIDCTVESNKVEGNDNLFESKLAISIKDTPDHPSQYNIDLVAIGFFTVTDTFPNIEQIMAVTGSSILYSASREFLLHIMLRGPWKPIMLAPVSFAPPPPVIQDKP